MNFILFVNLCFSQKDTANQLVSFVKNNYKIQYPKSWRLDTSGIMGSELFVFSPLENDTDGFHENVNVIIQDLSGQNIDLKEYKEISDKQITDMGINAQLFESSILKTDKGECYKISYAMTQDKYRLKITSVCFIKNDKAYLATFSSELDKYDRYKKVGETILNSFSLTK